ncbi:DUF6328 family protein [Kutzneria chonburiensis]|uniref:DUF6328 family protein n=1 Tax=Kutzneria chonburiensis TaxID=1483604 RepID=A0ABV6N7M1_9PSEU|nr:DUF6328 family protein [Kutzneria chonburiensis]
MSSPEQDEHQRLARNVGELLQELRVAQNGVQVLFGFLLSVVFTESYRQAGEFVHVTHVVVVMLTAASAGFLIAPAAWHRVLFRRGAREAIVDRASRFVIIGLVLLAAAMAGTVLLIGYVVFGGIVGGVLGGVIGLLFGLLWFVWPRTFDAQAGPR